jgi:hypothetical protein
MFALFTRMLPLLLLLASGCEVTDSSFAFDAGADFSLLAQVTRVGAGNHTCCLETRGAQFALYLANAVEGGVEPTGNEHPSTGQLHIADPYGHDYVLGEDVPAFGYGFSPDGRWAVFLAKSKQRYSLNLAALEQPDFHKSEPIQVIADGVPDYPLKWQSFYTPSGRYLVVNVLPNRVKNSADLHIVDLRTARDVYTLVAGAGDYFPGQVTANDEIVFHNSTSSTVPGTPSVEGLYVASMPLLVAGQIKPTLIDTHVSLSQLMADGVTVLYQTSSGNLHLYDLETHYAAKVASNVSTFSAGPGRRGPIAWVGRDGSLHVTPKLGPELLALPPGSADLFTSVLFSPEGARIYWFKKWIQQDNQGDLYTIPLSPPSQEPVLVGARVSSIDFNFFRNRFLHVRNVDAYGATGDLVSAEFDGSHLVELVRGAPLGTLQMAFPSLEHPFTPKSGNQSGPPDLSPEIIPPVFATLTDTRLLLDETTRLPRRAIDDAPPLTGALFYGRDIDQPMGPVANQVHQGVFEFSDDGQVLAFAADATWDDNLLNFVGKLQFVPTRRDLATVPPTLEGVTEIGPIVGRALFANAPGHSSPGIYFIKF